MAIYRIKNQSGADGTWVGQLIADGASYDIHSGELSLWKLDSQVFIDVGNGNLVVSDGNTDFTDPTKGWTWLSGDHLPRSNLDNTKLAVHSSPKPDISGLTTYAVWTGAGDDMGTGNIGDGPLLHFASEVGVAQKTVDVEFHEDHGRVWLHEGYVKFSDAGSGDEMSAGVVANATPLQTSVNLDLVIENNWVKFAPGGPGTGTHGFADASKIALIRRSYSLDGDWDYDGINLTPNAEGTGLFKISDIERVVHRFVNRIPCYGTASNFFTLSSDETTELPKNYFLRVTQKNVSDTVWHASVILEIYRERTFVP